MLQLLRKIIPENFIIRMLWHRLIGLMAALYYGFPAKKLNIIGVTGTDGKSSTTEFLVSILEEAGYKVGLASTIRFQIGNRKWRNETHKTTLGRFKLQKLLKKMKDEKCDIVVIEVSSHALEQGRLIGVPFTSAIITNLSPEHLDFHKIMKNYSLAKQKLFRNVISNNHKKHYKTSLTINNDDSNLKDFHLYKAERKILYSLNSIKNKADINAYPIINELKIDKSLIELIINDCKVNVQLNIIGDFSIQNALAAASTAYHFLIQDNKNDVMETIKKGLEKVKLVKGRMEIVDTETKLANINGITCMIDFGLTPKAVELLYKTLRKIVKNNKIIAVFGACGNRDKTKRPLIGKLAHALTNEMIICDDETYGEDFGLIRKDIIKGIDLNKSGANLHEIPDRKEAIFSAVKMANKGDIIVVSGIGDFTSRQIYDKQIEWNEREVIRMALKEKYNQ